MTAPPSQPNSDTSADPLDDYDWDDEIADAWAFDDPHLNRTAFPCTDNNTAHLIHEAAKNLTIIRAPMALGDAGATVSVLVSLAGEADSQLWDAVADARDQGYTWDQIADRLATSVTTARRRYSAYTTWRKTHPLDHD